MPRPCTERHRGGLTLVSREIYARAFDGIAYRSKYGEDLDAGRYPSRFS
jgi:hypothetical protein